MLKWKLQIEKIEDSAIWTKLVILRKLSFSNKHDFSHNFLVTF